MLLLERRLSIIFEDSFYNRQDMWSLDLLKMTEICNETKAKLFQEATKTRPQASSMHIRHGTSLLSVALSGLTCIITIGK